MKKYFMVLVLVAGCFTLALAWGPRGHQHINRAAVLGLPVEVRPFFYNHIDFITEEAVVPDLRKYTINDRAEFPRHYIDLELYSPESNVAELPATMREAKSKYPDSMLNKAGTLPWTILEVEEKLTKAFRAKKKTEILFLAGDLGHYIGDAHMPLHTALNHDGQLTGQKGIHALWEGQLPETFGEGYNLYTGEAKYIDDLSRETWAMIDSSHRLVEKVLAVDKELAASMPRERVYVLDSAGRVVANQYGDVVHTKEYAREFHRRLGGMVEKQLRGAIAEVSAFWYTAWVNAGKPDLSGLDPMELTERNKKDMERDLKRWKEGRVEMVRPTGDFERKWVE
ncbi:zinc dependent phospholipase C family protein [Puia sp. P3]|uniref:zinc dependent phospholipase C family protein n=1 Tax=Puia sp. P3 TaxID=3423952 RepID=UPI003D66A15E